MRGSRLTGDAQSVASADYHDMISAAEAEAAAAKERRESGIRHHAARSGQSQTAAGSIRSIATTIRQR